MTKRLALTLITLMNLGIAVATAQVEDDGEQVARQSQGYHSWRRARRGPPLNRS